MDLVINKSFTYITCMSSLILLSKVKTNGGVQTQTNRSQCENKSKNTLRTSSHSIQKANLNLYTFGSVYKLICKVLQVDL